MVANKRAIYVDLDDVICNTTENFTKIAQQEFGKIVQYESITSFDLQRSFQLTASEYEHFFNIIHRPATLMGFKPVDHAISILTQWEELGYHVDVVTGRPASTRDISLEWLKFYSIPFHSFTVVDKYHRNSKDNNFHQSISLADLSMKPYLLAVEDSWEMACFISQSMDTPVILFDRPWNRRNTNISQVHRIHNWLEIQSIHCQLHNLENGNALQPSFRV